MDDLERGGDTDAKEETEGGALQQAQDTATTTSTSIVIAENLTEVLCSKFVLFQLFFNIVASFIGPLGTFFLLFGYLSEGPYEWYSGPLIGVVVGSLAGSPVLIFALMPVALPEAVEKGWFPKLSIEKCPKLPFLEWQWATARNMAWTMVIGIILVPIALLIAALGLGPTLSTWQLIWFNVIYEVVLTIPVVCLGLLGYAVHLDAILERMSKNPNACRRLMKRVLSSLKMTVCP
jgi:hypothetical protein